VSGVGELVSLLVTDPQTVGSRLSWKVTILKVGNNVPVTKEKLYTAKYGVPEIL